ncbi:MAG: hypothetical protein IKQ43_01030 [Treponema sp.]|nr:hypothetical protein [Treponema sp.]MBR6153001.1 hypothetical protein [Treponema sp.]
MSDDLISEFVDKTSMDALATLIETKDIDEVSKSGAILASAFSGSDAEFKQIADTTKDAEKKLISSFSNNLVLLIQKTWVEKSDEDLKARVLYNLQEFTNLLNKKSYTEAYPLFLETVDNVVYLMFGVQTKSKDFENYALRIDPEFGIFWWYIKSLPQTQTWAKGKTRVALLLGMYFLANY